MKIKPKEIMVNLPVALLFDTADEIPSFASNINSIIHGKVRLKVEELGTLGGRYVALFYLQRNNEFQQIHDEFIRLIENEECERVFPSKEDLGDDDEKTSEPDVEHICCLDCDDLDMLHHKGLMHCVCGEDWINGKCESKWYKK